MQKSRRWTQFLTISKYNSADTVAIPIDSSGPVLIITEAKHLLWKSVISYYFGKFLAMQRYILVKVQ